MRFESDFSKWIGFIFQSWWFESEFFQCEKSRFEAALNRIFPLWKIAIWIGFFFHFEKMRFESGFSKWIGLIFQSWWFESDFSSAKNCDLNRIFPLWKIAIWIGFFFTLKKWDLNRVFQSESDFSILKKCDLNRIFPVRKITVWIGFFQCEKLPFQSDLEKMRLESDFSNAKMRFKESDFFKRSFLLDFFSGTGIASGGACAGDSWGWPQRGHSAFRPCLEENCQNKGRTFRFLAALSCFKGQELSFLACLAYIPGYPKARAVFTTFAQAELRAQMHISKVNLGQAIEHPMVMPKDFVEALEKHRRLDLLWPAADANASRPILAEYWRRFRALYGGHGIFKICTPQQLEHTVPCKIHGDEGRSALLQINIYFLIFFGFFQHMQRMCDVMSFQHHFRQEENSDNVAELATMFGQRHFSSGTRGICWSVPTLEPLGPPREFSVFGLRCFKGRIGWQK